MKLCLRKGILSVLAVVLSASQWVQAYPQHCTHSSLSDYYDSLRILEIEILHINSEGLMDYKFEDSQKIEVGRFQVTEKTRFEGEAKGGAIVIYCIKHGTGPNERWKNLLYVEKLR